MSEHIVRLHTAPVHEKALRVAECAALRGMPVLTVALIGPPGAGKTSLIEATARQLRGTARIGVIALNPAAERDADRVSRYCTQVEAVKAHAPTAAEINSVLPRFNFNHIEMLMIETVGGIAGAPDLGQDVTVTVLCWSGGDDKAAEYATLVANSKVLILNKSDLQRHVMFDRGAFRADVRRINSDVEVIEISTYENKGLERWIAFLNRCWHEKNPSPDVRAEAPRTDGE